MVYSGDGDYEGDRVDEKHFDNICNRKVLGWVPVSLFFLSCT